MRIISFVGTRPEIIKNLAFCRAAEGLPGLDLLVMHSGQNFGPNMADGFFRELNIPLAHQNAAVDRSSPGATAKSLLDYAHDCIRSFRPDAIISNTDTNTAFYTALAGAQARVPVAHFEGGIRCEARLNPEEINRRLADHLATWVFTISDEDTESLVAEGFPPSAVFMLGDITLDALLIVMAEHGIIPRRGDYDVLTVHRQENANDPKRLAAILEGVVRGGFPTVFPVHPRTRSTLESSGILQRVSRSEQIRVCDPLAYVPMVRLVAGCRKVISDSGGLRREAYMLGKPVISLVSFIWFKKMDRLKFSTVADANPERIASAIAEFDPPGPRPPLFGDGHSACRILETIMRLKP